MKHNRKIQFIYVIGALLGFAATSLGAATPAAHRKASSVSSVQSQLAAAEALLHQGRTEEARVAVQAVLAAEPTNNAAYNLLGIIYSGQKDFTHAQQAFATALKFAPFSTRTRNNLGNVYAAQGLNERAEHEFSAVLRLEPANQEANYNLGILLISKGAPAEAIPHLQHIHPANLPTSFNLIRAYLRARRNEEALRLVKELSSQTQTKSDVQFHFTLGVLLAAEKQYKAAQFELETANSLKPETFEILYNLGQTYLRGTDYAKAEFSLNRALRIQPDSPDALYLLGQVYSEEARPVDALDLLIRAHHLAPENADIIFLLARVSMSQNYWEDAIPLLESGLKSAPRRVDLQAALGESYFMSGKVEKSIESFTELIKLEPSARSYVFMGLSHRHLGRLDEARKYFVAGLKLDPHNASCLYNLGYIEERQGNQAKAEDLFQQALRYNPDYPDALLELANLRSARKEFAEAAELLRKYVKVSRNPATGYYKLAMAERSLHQMEAAQRDLSVFQTISKNASTGPYPYQHLFDYLDNRSTLAPQQQSQLDEHALIEQLQKHPDQPQDLYQLSETYLKLGKTVEARATLTQLDQLSAGDYRTQTGIGVLLARYHLYDDAISHFQAALQANPGSDDVKFDLADAYFRRGRYDLALQTAQGLTEQGRQDDSFLALLGDIYGHLGETSKATSIYQEAITRSPDNDQHYLSLALVKFRDNDLDAAEQALQAGLKRVPSSGKLLWGMGIVSVLQGKTPQAGDRFERAVDLLPEWAGSHSTLGIFYYQTGQIEKAREVLNRFKGSAAAGLDTRRIEEALANAPASITPSLGPMPDAAKNQFLQLALSIADRTL